MATIAMYAARPGKAVLASGHQRHHGAAMLNGEPTLLALIVPPAQSTARAAGQRVGMADVEVLTEQINHLNRLGQEFGSGRVREQVVVLHREANQLLHGSYSEKIGKALLSGVARRINQVFPTRSTPPSTSG